MGVTYNNRIVTDGLVLCLDAAQSVVIRVRGLRGLILKGE